MEWEPCDRDYSEELLEEIEGELTRPLIFYLLRSLFFQFVVLKPKVMGDPQRREKMVQFHEEWQHMEDAIVPICNIIEMSRPLLSP